MDNRKIVVITDLTIQKRKDGKMFAAHMDVLGLTAYGRTAESARENLTQCYSRWVHLHREAGILPKRLNELEAKWQWLDEYDGDIPVEDTAPNPPSSDLSYEEEVLDRILVAPAA